jgi:hypothetical protein
MKRSLTMQIRITRARGIAAVGLLTAMASFGALAQTPDTVRPETSLLGVHLLATYNDVLSKFGQPNEIQVGDPTVSGQGQLPANSGASSGTGFPGMGGKGGGMPGMMPGGMLGKGGGMPGMPGMMPGGMSGGRGGGMAGGPPGMMPGGMMPGKGIGLPGMGGPAGSSGGYPGMGGGSAGGNNTVEDSGETTWWYHFPHQGLHYSFLFNKEGRVIQIQAYGQQPAPKIAAPRSAQGITLGSDFGLVIRKYGWSNDGEHSGDYVVMRYGKLDRIAFQSRHNRVLGIVLGRVSPETARPATVGLTGGYPGGSGTPGGNPGGDGSSAGGGNE